MSELWRQSLERIRKQFDAISAKGQLITCLLQECGIPESGKRAMSLYEPMELMGRQLRQTDTLGIHNHPAVRYPATGREDLGLVSRFSFYGDAHAINDFQAIAQEAGLFVLNNIGVRTICPDISIPRLGGPKHKLIWSRIVFDLACISIPGSTLSAEPFIIEKQGGFSMTIKLKDLQAFRRGDMLMAGSNVHDAMQSWINKITDPPEFAYMQLPDIVSGSSAAIDILLERASRLASPPADVPSQFSRTANEAVISEPQERRPPKRMNETIKAAAKYIRENPGQKGAVVANAISVTTEHFYSRIVPKLKENGFYSDDGYRPPKRRKN